MYRIDSNLIEKKIKIDVKDQKILDILSENSRTPISVISKKVELGRDTAAYRVKRLEKHNIILSYYPKYDFKKLGFNVYHIFYTLKGDIRKQELVEYLINLGCVISIFDYNDRRDLEVIILSKNIKELDKLLSKIEQDFTDYIFDTEKVLEIIKYQSILFSYHFNKDIDRLNLDFEDKESYYKPDKLDFEILNEISKDCTRSTYKLAKVIDLSPDSIGLRLKKLHEERIIKKYTILPNLSKLGFAWRTVFIKTKSFNYNIEKKFKDYASHNPNIKGASKVFGNFSILMYLISDNRNKYHQTIIELRNLFSENMKIQESLVCYKELYFEPFPKVVYDERLRL